MRTRLFGVAAIAIVAVGALVVLTGGSSDDEGDPSGTAVAQNQENKSSKPHKPIKANESHKKFVGSADRLCVAAARKVRSLGQATNYRELTGIMSKTLPIGRRLIRRLEALGPPPRGRPVWSDYIEMNREALRYVQEARAAANARDAAGLGAVMEEFEALSVRAREFERDFGLTDCARF